MGPKDGGLGSEDGAMGSEDGWVGLGLEDGGIGSEERRRDRRGDGIKRWRTGIRIRRDVIRG